MSALGDTMRQVFVTLKELKDRVADLETDSGEVSGFHFGDSFPSSPYPNQIVIRADETPPAGGTMYRYDNDAGVWLRLN